jgi:hypothetical protein
MKHEIHGAKTGSALDQFPAFECFFLKIALLRFCHVRVFSNNVIMGSKEKSAGSTGRVADGFTGLWGHHIYYGAD